MGKLLFNLPDETLDRFRDFSDATGVSMSQHLRQAVDDLLSRRTPCGIVMSGQVVSGYALVVRQ